MENTRSRSNLSKSPFTAILLVLFVITMYSGIVIFQLTTIPPLTHARLKFQDGYFKARLLYNEYFKKDSPKESATVLIAIDNESMAEFKQGSSTNKKFIAKIIDKIAEYSPKVIVLGIMLGNNGDNLVIAEAIKRAGNVIIAYSSNSGLDKVDRAVLAASLRCGCADILPISEDNIQRAFVTQQFDQKNMFGPFAVPLEAALIYRDIPLKEITLKGQENSFIIASKNEAINIPVKRYNEALINYLYAEKNIPTISTHKLLEGNFAPSILKNKIAILCVTADTSSGSIHSTPIGRLSGGAVMANIANSVAASDFLREITFIHQIVVLYLVTGFLAFVFYKRRALQSFIVLIFAIGLSLAISFVLFLYNFIWSAFDLITLAFLLYIAIMCHKAYAGLEK